MEAIIYGGTPLHIHLALPFNCCIKTGYVPRSYMQSLIIPLIKSKSAYFTYVNNYRAIAVSTAASKLFECIVAEEYHSTSPEDMCQFGFKAHHSTRLCTSILKRTVNYYTERGSHAFLCFIDLKSV